MDDQHFDDLARRLARGGSRRALLKGVLGTAGGVLAARGAAPWGRRQAQGEVSVQRRVRRLPELQEENVRADPRGVAVRRLWHLLRGACTPSPDTPFFALRPVRAVRRRRHLPSQGQRGGVRRVWGVLRRELPGQKWASAARAMTLAPSATRSSSPCAPPGVCSPCEICGQDGSRPGRRGQMRPRPGAPPRDRHLRPRGGSVLSKRGGSCSNGDACCAEDQGCCRGGCCCDAGYCPNFEGGYACCGDGEQCCNGECIPGGPGSAASPAPKPAGTSAAPSGAGAATASAAAIRAGSTARASMGTASSAAPASRSAATTPAPASTPTSSRAALRPRRTATDCAALRSRGAATTAAAARPRRSIALRRAGRLHLLRPGHEVLRRRHLRGRRHRLLPAG